MVLDPTVEIILAIVGIFWAACSALSGWALLKVINLTERVIALETQRVSDHEQLKSIEAKLDKIMVKVGAV